LEKINKRKMLVIGVLFLLLGASTVIGVSASNTNGQNSASIQRTIPAIQKDIVAQTSLVGNVKISPNAGNDYHPRMATTATGTIVIVYEEEADIFTKDMPVVYSPDNGQTWTQQFLFNSLDFQGSGLLQYPDIVYNAPNDLLYTAAIDPNADQYNNEMYFIPGDIATATEANGYAISGTSSSGYWDCACTCTNNFFLSLTTEDYSGTLLQILGLGWFTSPDFAYPPGLGGYYYDGQSLFHMSPVSQLEMSHSTNRVFIVGEVIVGSDLYVAMKSGAADEALITSGEQQNGMDKYGDVEQIPAAFIGFGSDPDVSGSGSNVCVVYVRDGNVMCSRSSCGALYDPGFSWQESTIETGASTPAVYMQGDNAICAYVKGGNLYAKLSSDDGATWGTAEKLNDVDGTVVAEKGAVCVDKLGVAFEDNRNGNIDIYFAAKKGAPSAELVIQSISGGIGVSAVVKNTGDAAATNVAWTIASTGTIFVGKEKSGTIATLAPGASVTIKSGLMLGFGSITTTVTVGTATASKTFKLLLILVK